MAVSLVDILAVFRADIARCDNVIAHAHANDPDGRPFFSVEDLRQITIGAFLNMFIAWETFLESSFIDFMTGSATIGGKQPVKYVSPPSAEQAHKLLIGTQRYFDYGNHDNVRKMARIFFEDGYPYEPRLSEIFSDLADLRTMRNASAHITSTTQNALESLALRIFGEPKVGIDLYRMLTAPYPQNRSGDTVYTVFRDKLLIAATLIAQG